MPLGNACRATAKLGWLRELHADCYGFGAERLAQPATSAHEEPTGLPEFLPALLQSGSSKHPPQIKWT